MSNAINTKGSQKKILAIVPAYNEEKRVGAVVQELISRNFSVVVVDDGSKDNTVTVAKKAGAFVLTHCLNLGQGAALATGLRFAEDYDCDFAVTFDADGQHDPDDILSAVEALEHSEADILLGSRFTGAVTNMPLSRKYILKAALLFTKLSTGLNVTDTHNGFRIIRHSALSHFRLKHNRMAHASEIHDIIKSQGIAYIEFPNKIRYTEETLQKGQKMSGAFAILSDLLLGRLYK